ncbi:hypothetical protein HMPREF1139_1800 [Campylobacter sp. FOBRC14]|nr:hypothetical protein HMPREF1139_1800 [Campylobacter sp. FOBRC14]
MNKIKPNLKRIYVNLKHNKYKILMPRLPIFGICELEIYKNNFAKCRFIFYKALF